MLRWLGQKMERGSQSVRQLYHLISTLAPSLARFRKVRANRREFAHWRVSVCGACAGIRRHWRGRFRPSPRILKRPPHLRFCGDRGSWRGSWNSNFGGPQFLPPTLDFEKYWKESRRMRIWPRCANRRCSHLKALARSRSAQVWLVIWKRNARYLETIRRYLETMRDSFLYFRRMERRQ